MLCANSQMTKPHFKCVNPSGRKVREVSSSFPFQLNGNEITTGKLRFYVGEGRGSGSHWSIISLWQLNAGKSLRHLTQRYTDAVDFNVIR